MSTELATAYVSLVPSMQGVQGKLTQELTPAAAAAGKDAGKSAGEGMTSGIGGSVKKMAAVIGGAFVVAKGVDFFRGTVEAARESEAVANQTAAAIKATGGAAKLTADQVGDLAGSISAKTGVDDEAIQSGANLLLTFKNIKNEAGKGNDIFSQTASIMTDVSAAMGQEPKAAAIQLGKALNDPIKGVAQLNRIGVTFTDKQKAVIKSLQESGDIAGAQKVILEELNSEFGGTAAAIGTPADKLKVSLGNLQESIGAKLIPVMDHLSQAGVNALAWASEHTTTVKALALAIGAAGAAFVAYKTVSAAVTAVQTIASTATKAYAAAQWLLNAAMSANPIALVVIALAALAAGIVLAWKHSETFRDVVLAVWAAVKTGVNAALSFFTSTVPAAFSKVLDWVKAHWGLIVSIIGGPLTAVVVQIIKHWDQIKTAFSNGIKAAVDLVKSLPGRILGALGDLGGLLYNAGKEIIGGLIRGISDKISDIGDVMGKVAGKIKSFLPGSPVKTGPLVSWNNGGAGKRLVSLLAQGLSDTGPVDRAMSALAGGIAMPSLSVPSSPSLRGVGAGGGGSDTPVVVQVDGHNLFQFVIAKNRAFARDTGTAPLVIA